jgi:hypothetical protein
MPIASGVGRQQIQMPDAGLEPGWIGLPAGGWIVDCFGLRFRPLMNSFLLPPVQSSPLLGGTGLLVVGRMKDE